MESGEPITGVRAVAGETWRGAEHLGGGWMIPQPMPFDPNPQSPDPCVRFCERVHEWVHHTDRRRYNVFWDPGMFQQFTEIPAYRKQADCLESFL